MELVGECGSGKTQLCMQVNFTFPLWQSISPLMLSQTLSQAYTPCRRPRPPYEEQVRKSYDASMVMGDKGSLCRWPRSRR